MEESDWGVRAHVLYLVKNKIIFFLSVLPLCECNTVLEEALFARVRGPRRVIVAGSIVALIIALTQRDMPAAADPCKSHLEGWVRVTRSSA